MTIDAKGLREKAVRLWWVPGYRPMLDLWTKDPHPEGDGEDDAVAYLALPAAEHAALVALLWEARGALAAKVVGHHFRAGEATGFSEEGMDITYGPDVHIADCPGCRSQDARDSLLSRLDAAIAGLGGAGKSPEVRS